MGAKLHGHTDWRFFPDVPVDGGEGGGPPRQEDLNGGDQQERGGKEDRERSVRHSVS